MLDLFGGYYARPRPTGEVVALVGLTDSADARVRTLSGGQLRRLDLALALVGDPELIFLDEPTTGFDPEARRRAWDTVGNLRDLGKTVVLTTHYLEEAQHLADRVAILREGRIVATGSPQELLSADGSVEIRYRRLGELVVLHTEEPTRVLNEITGEAIASGIQLEALEVRRQTLEDVYLDLVQEDG
jgi:ABC-2 type transport system ATP-binding protein